MKVDVDELRSFETSDALGNGDFSIIHAAADEIEALRKEIARRDANEHRNCINWGPCSRNDGRMSEPGVAIRALAGKDAAGRGGEG